MYFRGRTKCSRTVPLRPLRSKGLPKIVFPGLPDEKQEIEALFEGLEVEFEFGPIELSNT